MDAKRLDRKIEYWKHRLLDLGKRNKMIHYRETKRTTLKLTEPSFHELFDQIALKEETMTFQKAVDKTNDIRVFSMLSLLEHLSASLTVTIGDIKTASTLSETQITLNNLRAKARLSLEEQGINILYLSFGLIEWKDGKDSSAQWIRSPLILVPASLTLTALHAPYMLSKYDDDIVVNPTLTYYLKTEYGIDLPPFDAEHDVLDDYLKDLETIADQRGWRIIREVRLGLLSFLKISMYHDLHKNEERIKNNPIIRSLAGDIDAINDIHDAYRTFDPDCVKAQDCYQVMPADSSQQDAILYSKKNVSFVMQGPPGTGKSQTITNIIAEALADGKKILFVSEKMAALQVVYHRLQEAHLADFCLPLHSYKANKKEILAQIGANLNLNQTRVNDQARMNLEELDIIRQELNQYAYELHMQNPELYMSCYEVYSELEKVKDAESITFCLEDILSVSPSQLQMYLNQIKAYASAVKQLNYDIKENAWEGLCVRTTGYEYSNMMQMTLSHAKQILIRIQDLLQKALVNQEIYDQIRYADLEELALVLSEISKLPMIPQIWVTCADMDDMIRLAERACDDHAKQQRLKHEIADVFTDAIYHYPYNEWKKVLLDDANQFTKLSLLTDKSATFYVRHATEMMQILVSCKKHLVHAGVYLDQINALLGISLSNHTQVMALVEILQDHVILNNRLFESDIKSIKQMISDAQTTQKQANKLKEKILRNWEKEVFDFDYASVLSRYKTEYTSFFRIFNSRYKQDKRQIQSLSKTVIKNLSDDTAIDLLNDLKCYHERIVHFNELTAELCNQIGDSISGMDSDWNRLIKTINQVEKLRQLPFEIPTRMMNVLSRTHTEEIRELSDCSKNITSEMTKVKEIIEQNHLHLDITSSRFDVRESLNLLDQYVIMFDELREHIKPLKSFLLKETEPIDVIYETVEKLNEYESLHDTMTKLSDTYQKHFDFYYSDPNMKWSDLVDILHQVKAIKEAKSYPFVSSLINVCDERKRGCNEISAQLLTIYQEGDPIWKWLQQQFCDQVCFSEYTLDALSDKINACLKQIHMLDNWIDYQETKDQCNQSGLADFIAQAESKDAFYDLDKRFLKGFYEMWLGAICDKLTSVRRFRKETQDARIKKFMELDDLQLLIAQMRIREKLIADLPSSHHMLKATDEVAILNRELGKKRNIMPLRKLFRQIPNLLMRLKPCLMMSPLSVSYFLEADAYHFDLVIFDEASQIFPEDAIGAIFRGSQVIIVGDSKQLPPTNFFAASTNNLDGNYDINDEEDDQDVVSDSILEEAVSALPNRTLLWHYRSKNESLITFSNREIYQNKLITFPTSDTKREDTGVSYVYVEDGYYEGGGKNCNVREAQTCVKLVLEHIEKYPDRSLGIIAFSEKQQIAIEHEVMAFREHMPQYEWFFDETKDEPFFIKNLENVQGDERDTILFSIGYAKDQAGKMYMRFGPLSQEGGERRLNVAITRAKINLKLIGSILPSDMDMRKTKSAGVRMLRAYIDFAMNGECALRPAERKEFTVTDDFCNGVANFLQAHGYHVKQQVGYSDFKIDIAIENPNIEGKYIAGIMCDGLSYVQAKTARDRDHLREIILRNMGWNIYHVWSTEWIRHTQIEKDALLDFLHHASNPVVNTSNPMTENNDHVIENNDYVTENKNQFTQNEQEFDSVSVGTVETIASETPRTNLDASNPYGFSYYEEADWQEAPHTDDSDDLTYIAENILYIVYREQPIHMEWLYKRMGPSFTVGKATEQVKYMIDEAIRTRLRGSIFIDQERFVRLLPLTSVNVRILPAQATPRPLAYIHTEEIAAAMVIIVKNTFGISEEDLINECLHVFGYERSSPKRKERMETAIRYLVDHEIICVVNGKVRLKGDAI